MERFHGHLLFYPSFSQEDTMPTAQANSILNLELPSLFNTAVTRFLMRRA